MAEDDKKTGVVMCRGRIHYFYKNSRVCACGKKVRGQIEGSYVVYQA